MTFRSPALLPALFLCSALALTGCGVGMPATATPQTMHLNITGNVHGGQQPVAGARIFVLQAAIAGYGSPANDLIAHSPSGPALVKAQGGGNDDTLKAYYTVANATGGFTITGDYLCNGSGPVYVLATQGNPGLGAGQTNPALAELAVVASACSFNSTLSATQQIGITEQSTVTGVYALAGYMTGINKLSAPGGTLAQTGLTNAGSTALGLSNLPTGTPLAQTAAGATVPTAKINLLADILAACVNSNGTGTACTTLFANATADGTSTGTKPTDTVTALLNIAHHPAANLTALYGLAAASAPYQPILATQPTDLTLALKYPSITISGGYSTNPNLPSIDASGDTVIPGELYQFEQGFPGGVTDNLGSLTVLGPTGATIFSESAAASTVAVQPEYVAVDPFGFGWFASGASNTNSDQLYRANLTTGATTQYTAPGTEFGGPSNCIASDASGNIYVCDSAHTGVAEFDKTGVYENTALGGGRYAPTGIAIDGTFGFLANTDNPSITIDTLPPNYANFSYPYIGNGPNSLALDSAANLWITTVSNNSLVYVPVTRTGSGLSQQASLGTLTTYTGGGLNFNTSAQPLVQIVVDGASSAWVPNYAGKSISAFSNASGGTSTALSPAATAAVGSTPAFAGGFQTGCPSKGLAIDGSGNVWVTCDIGNTANAVGTGTPLVEFIGLAVPVATPILPGQFGARP